MAVVGFANDEEPNIMKGLLLVKKQLKNCLEKTFYDAGKENEGKI